MRMFFDRAGSMKPALLCAALSAALSAGVAGCASAPQAAAQGQASGSRASYLSSIREEQSQGVYFASLAHIDAFELKYGAAPDVELLRAQALRGSGQSAASAAVYGKLLDTEVGASAAQGLGLLAGGRGDYDGAVRYLRQAAKREPANAGILNDLGNALLSQGNPEAARVPVAQAAELEPENPKYLATLALLLLASNQPAQAADVMNKANLPFDLRADIYRRADELNGKRPLAGQPPARPATLPATIQDMPAPSAQAVPDFPPLAPAASAEPVAVPQPVAPPPAVRTIAPMAGSPLRSLRDRLAPGGETIQQ